MSNGESKFDVFVSFVIRILVINDDIGLTSLTHLLGMGDKVITVTSLRFFLSKRIYIVPARFYIPNCYFSRKKNSTYK